MFFAALFCSLVASISLFRPVLAILLLVAVITFLIVLIFNKNYKYIAVLLSVVLFSISLAFELVEISQIKIQDGENVNGKFVIVEEAVDQGEYNTLILKETNCSALPRGTKLLAFDYNKNNVKPGDMIDATISLNAVEKSDKYRLSNYSERIYVTGNIQKIKKTGNKNFVYNATGQIRNFVKKKVTDFFTGDTAGLLVAITTGDKSLISDEFFNNVKTTGISHVIVVSGMHLSIIMMAIFWCIDHLFYNKYVRCILSIVLVVIIYSICGFTMSISRAGAMFIVASLAPILNRDNDSLSSIFTAITGILILTPFAIVNVSFLLSLLSTIAIIWIVPFYYRVIVEKFDICSKFIKTIIASVLCSVFAILFTLPVTIKVFGYVSIVSPFTNLLVNVPVTIGIVFNVLAIIISAIPYIKIIAYPLFLIAGLCSRIIVFIVDLFAKIPITVAVMPKVAFWWSIVLITIIIGNMYLYEYRRKRTELNANCL